MKYIDKKILKKLSQQYDLLNTINGGVSATSVRVVDFADKSEILVSSPSVNPELFNIYINNDDLMIFSMLPHVQEGSPFSVSVPMFSRTFPLPPFADKDRIEAVHEGHGLKIVIPFNTNSNGALRKIDIKDSF